jgi:hypothetical protein
LRADQSAVLSHCPQEDLSMKTVFFRVLEADDKAAALLAAIHDPKTARGKQRFEVDPARFASVPRSPFAYWVSPQVRGIFTRFPNAESQGRRFTKGLCTTDDTRFVRLVWEVPVAAIGASRGDLLSGKQWAFFVNGGATTAFYRDYYLCLGWAGHGVELKRFLDGKIGRSGQWSRWINSVEHYFQPGMTWPLRTSRFSPQALPQGVIFSIRSYAGFAPTAELLWLLAVAASLPFDFLFKTSLGRARFPEFVVGVLQQLPIPSPRPEMAAQLSSFAHRGWSQKRSLDTANETSHAFALPALLQAEGDSLADRVSRWTERARTVEVELGDIQAEIDERCFKLYGVGEEDRKAIEAGGQWSVASNHEMTDCAASENDSAEEVDEPATTGDITGFTAELLSWTVGVAFGRFDMRLVTGERPLPSEPEPFDPLPVCSPGMLTGDDGLPLTREDESRQKADGSWQYPMEIPWGGILADDPGHPLDIEKAVLSVQWSGVSQTTDHRSLTTDHYEEACEILGVKSLRDYFRKPANFFADHLKRYSKSRRQAPIYWPLSTASGSYTLWIYYHRLTDQTLYACVNDFVQPKLNDLERDTPRLRDEKRTKELQAAVALQSELEEFKQELLAWAPRWKPNLNDGVLITACPLWKLFRLPKWRKDLEACWKKLEAGDYDWAHLAYSLWPERVRGKCKQDRSLAIAHGLEDICEIEPPKAKKAKKGRRTKNEAAQMDLNASGDSEV